MSKRRTDCTPACLLQALVQGGEGDTQLLAAITADGGTRPPAPKPIWDCTRPMDEEGRPLLPLDYEDEEEDEQE